MRGTRREEAGPRPRRLRRWQTVVGAVGVVAACMVAGVGAGPASAQEFRSQMPIVAGTRVGVPGMQQCTVGAVLQSNGFFARVTARQRGVRFLVLAKHCATYGSPVTVGGREVGKVAWTAPDDDVELVRVEPNVTRNVVCGGGSQLHDCSIHEQVSPRAHGRVFLSTAYGERAVPMGAPAVPGADESFCTSGASTGVNCSWKSVRTPPSGYSPGEAAAAHADGVGVIIGDSGGPVVGTGGQFYGIIVKRGIQANAGLMGFIPAARVLRAIGSGYGLAGPG